ncbi:NAD(P)-dependent oxidoreductase [Actinoalloteichus spitiensis]|uniref:NAD(P)-dependent oxidoreductase n=1 Tax=Actinoalloteichus spitiensis TaxID=252394 RepID=UPI00038247A3|nr:NAD(P)-binding domain-containing protein [Actinoalloteichus spitiensis]
MSDEPSTPAPVTLIGLGPMGRAMVRSLLRAGHPVTVWNRTASRADELVAEGAALAASPAEALAASEVVVLSLTDYQAMYDVLEPATSALAGRTLVNLSSDTPQVTREAARWAEGHGARFVTGGVMVPAVMVGTDACYVYYSGDRAVVERHEPTLAAIGEPRYVGPDPAAAQLFYQAQLAVFLTALAGLLQGTAMVRSAGVSAADFVPQAFGTLTQIPAMVAGTDEELDSGSYPGDQATATMMGATADHIVRTSAALGLDLALPGAVHSLYERAIAAGHGGDNWTSLFEVVRGTPA